MNDNINTANKKTKDKLMNFKQNEPIEIKVSTHQNSQDIDDAQTVLLSLGYERNEIKSAISKASAVLKDNASAEEILKETLKILSI